MEDMIVSFQAVVEKDSSTIAHLLKYKYDMNPLIRYIFSNIIYKYWISKFKSMG